MYIFGIHIINATLLASLLAIGVWALIEIILLSLPDNDKFTLSDK